MLLKHTPSSSRGREREQTHATDHPSCMLLKHTPSSSRGREREHPTEDHLAALPVPPAAAHFSGHRSGLRLIPSLATPNSSKEGLQPTSCWVVMGREYFSFGVFDRFMVYLNFAETCARSESASTEGAPAFGVAADRSVPPAGATSGVSCGRGALRKPQFSSHSAAVFSSPSMRSFQIFISAETFLALDMMTTQRKRCEMCY